ncbi:MAG: DUF2631 domain-containing protein [Jatrophihabitans sp.]
MALAPNSEPTGTGEPPDYAHDHPAENSKQWGWHGEWGGGARGGGWVVAAILLLMTTATNYQFEYHFVLWLFAAGLVAVLTRDRRRRHNQWRH